MFQRCSWRFQWQFRGFEGVPKGFNGVPGFFNNFHGRPMKIHGFMFIPGAFLVIFGRYRGVPTGFSGGSGVFLWISRDFQGVSGVFQWVSVRLRGVQEGAFQECSKGLRELRGRSRGFQRCPFSPMEIPWKPS